MRFFAYNKIGQRAVKVSQSEFRSKCPSCDQKKQDDCVVAQTLPCLLSWGARAQLCWRPAPWPQSLGGDNSSRQKVSARATQTWHGRCSAEWCAGPAILNGHAAALSSTIGRCFRPSRYDTFRASCLPEVSRLPESVPALWSACSSPS